MEKKLKQMEVLEPKGDDDDRTWTFSLPSSKFCQFCETRDRKGILKYVEYKVRVFSFPHKARNVFMRQS